MGGNCPIFITCSRVLLAVVLLRHKTTGEPPSKGVVVIPLAGSLRVVLSCGGRLCNQLSCSP